MLNLMDNAWALAVQSLDDLEKTRIAMANRIEVMTRAVDKADADGACRGLGLPENHPAVEMARVSHTTLILAEKDVIKSLERQFKDHPMYPVVRDTPGLGAKTVLRLMGSIGDPYWNYAHNRPRTVGELYSYCGLTPTARKRKGVQNNWNAEARKRLYVIAVGMIKNRNSRYRATYDQWKTYYTDRSVANAEGLTLKHVHDMAIRKMMRAIVYDLYQYASGLHEAAAKPKGSS